MNWDDMSRVEQLQCEWSDFHKDFYGFRPRWASEQQWNDVVFLERQIQMIHNEIAAMKKTFAGREALREQGWVVEETNQMLAQHAKWLAAEREREMNVWLEEAA